MEEDKGQKDEKTELDGPEAETIPLFYHRCEACYIKGVHNGLRGVHPAPLFSGGV